MMKSSMKMILGLSKNSLSVMEATIHGGKWRTPCVGKGEEEVSSKKVLRIAGSRLRQNGTITTLTEAGAHSACEERQEAY